MAEANVKVLKGMSASMLTHSKLGLVYERYALSYACHIRNRSIQGKQNPFIPFERYYQRESLVREFKRLDV